MRRRCDYILVVVACCLVVGWWLGLRWSLVCVVWLAYSECTHVSAGFRIVIVTLSYSHEGATHTHTLSGLECRFRAVRRRTGGRRRRWVVLWPAAAARREFFIGGGGVALWSAASDLMREHWNKISTRWTGVFFWFYRGQPLHLWSGRWRRKVDCEYACCTQFHSRNEFLEAHINAMLNVEGTLV